MCGRTKDDDWLPDRFFSIPTEVDGEKVVCNRDVFSKMHKEYYNALGWNDDGIPKTETIKNLDLEELTV